MNFKKIIRYLFVTVGIILLTLSVFIYFRTNNFINKSVSTEGVIIELRKEKSKSTSSSSRRSRRYEKADTSTFYRSIIQFEDLKKNKIVFSSSVASNPPDYQLNDKVSVLYLPESPQEAEINTFLRLWVGAIVTGAMGVIFFVVGLIVLIFKRND